MGSAWDSIRYGIRMWIRDPRFALLAALTLGLGIAANTSIFSIIDEVYLRPLPIESPQQLVRVLSTTQEELRGESSYPDYLSLTEASKSFAQLAAYSRKGVALEIDRRVEVVSANIISDNYFTVLGVDAAMGRVPSQLSSRGTEAPQIVISHGLWLRRYSADPATVGRSVRLNDLSCTIIGVLPQGFQGVDRFFAADVWVPMSVWSSLPNGSDALHERGMRWLGIIGRLRDGATMSQAMTESDLIARNLARQFPKTNQQVGMIALSESESQPRALLLVSGLLIAVGGLVLLIACTNLANLLSVQIAARRKEIATRAALGATRLQIVGQLSSEMLVLALLGSCIGLILAGWSMELLPALLPPLPLSIGFDFGLDSRAIAFALALSSITALLAGLPSGVKASGGDVYTNLRNPSASSRLRTRRIPFLAVFVAGQLAVSLVLLTAMGLLAQTVWNTEGIDPGFNKDQDMLLLQLSPGTLGYNEQQTRSLYDQLLSSMKALPGVKMVSLARRLPLSPVGGGLTAEVSIPGYESPPGEGDPRVHCNSVGMDYFRTMGTKILLGREFTQLDRDSSPPVVIVNQTMAARFWPGQDPVGKHLQIDGPGGPAAEVIGVAQDGKYQSLIEAPMPYLYLPLSQDLAYEVTLMVQTQTSPLGFADAVRKEISALDESIPTFGLTTLREHLRYASYQQTLVGSLVGTLGLLGFALAIVGVYGIVTYSTGRRASEFGLRMALGAQRADIFRQVLRAGLLMTGGGLVVGLLCAFAANRLISSLLFGVSAGDPATFVGTALFLAAVALLACAVPALRATKINPAKMLRAQ